MRELPGVVASERETLESFLDFQRATLLQKCHGLSGEQAGAASVAPSSLSLHGLIRHLAAVERWWFRRIMAGERIEVLYWTAQDRDADFRDVRADRWDDDVRTYREEVAAARAAVADMDLDARADGPNGPISLRWTYLHMVTEYARHNGHADLLRERLDGSVGW